MIIPYPDGNSCYDNLYNDEDERNRVSDVYSCGYVIAPVVVAFDDDVAAIMMKLS